ncbi:CRISPR-associated endonuclease Cas2 [Methanobrevibacter sp.]
MLTVVTYDISDNTSRNYLIKKLQYYGLKRLQKSVFIGYLEANERLDLADDVETYISSDADSIVILPMCEKCKSSILIQGDAAVPKNDLTYRFL